MRKITTFLALVAVLFPVVLFGPPSPARADIDPTAAAKQIQEAILNNDAKLFLSHMQGSTYFIDELYWEKDLAQMLRGGDNWLRRNLFDGEDSVKFYLETARELRIVVTPSDDEYVISYQSSNHPPHEWPWCSIKPRGKAWVFCDMFAYR